MNTLSKIFTLAATLTLAAGCDAEPEFGDADNHGDLEFRPGGFGIKLNGNLINDYPYDMMHLDGKFYEGIQLSKVCLRPEKYGSDEICIFPGEGDRLWVEGTQFFGFKKSHGMNFDGYDFDGSRWFLKLDYDNDGVLDSKVILNIDSVKERLTPNGDHYWAYLWTYFTYEVDGLIGKDMEQQKGAVPTCEVDPDTGSMETILSRNLHVDMVSADFSEEADTVFIGCMAGAVAKGQGLWGYLQEIVGIKFLEAVVRDVRADYCGDGVSWTETGIASQHRDVLGISGFVDSSLDTEAHWVPGVGAACLYEPRHPAVTFDKVWAHCGIPKCDPKATLGEYGSIIHSKIW